MDRTDIESAGRVWERVTAAVSSGANYTAAADYGEREAYGRAFPDGLDSAVRSGASCGAGEAVREKGGEPVSGMTAERVKLTRFMDAEASSAALYTTMASSCRDDRIRRMLLQMADDERRHLKKLQTAFFILTGDTRLPEKAEPSRRTSMLPALRDSYEAETRACRDYMAAAQAETDRAMAGDYRSMAEDEERHAFRLREVIGRMMR